MIVVFLQQLCYPCSLLNVQKMIPCMIKIMYRNIGVCRLWIGGIRIVLSKRPGEPLSTFLVRCVTKRD